VPTEWYSERVKQEKQFVVIQVPVLNWPPALEIPSKRFRLFVTADATGVNAATISDFALAALNRGMVYFCAWGPDCERLHDLVDEVLVEDDIGERKFAGPQSGDVIMTTWHANESIEEAIGFFAACAVPTDGFVTDSDYRVVVCVANEVWATEANKFLSGAEFLASDRPTPE
jgi:hypothetical protein